MEIGKNILIFGDSIPWGAWDFKEGGWADRLKKHLSKKKILVYNLGIPGDNSKFLLERFENEIPFRWDEDDGELMIIISIGINDSQYNKLEKKVKIDAGEFEMNIRKLSENARKFTKKIIFIGLTNVDESRTMPIIGTEKCYNNNLIKKYDSFLQNFCEKNKILFIPLFNLLDKSDLFDGLHPNEKGHEKIFKKVNNFLVKHKIIK